MQINTIINLKKSSFFILFFLFSAIGYAQQPGNLPINLQSSKAKQGNVLLNSIAGTNGDLFGKRINYIENIGQYGDTIAGFGNIGKILFGFEGTGMPVLFTTKGLIYLQRERPSVNYKDREEEEKKEKSLKQPRIDKVITAEWIHGNSNPRIITEGISKSYFTYGIFKKKAKAIKKITYKDIYPGIDLVYSFIKTAKIGFEFSLVVNPGADISKVKLKYGGDVRTIRQDIAGNLIIKSILDEITMSAPVCFYADDDNQQKFSASFLIDEKEIGFKVPDNYDAAKTLIIDPFVSPTTTLGSGTGVSNLGKANDIDFDYDGNIYISGGGDNTTHSLVKFDKNGVIQWTFNGVLSTPGWSFGPAHGGWVVEKTTGNIYLGQGLATGGFRVIRLNAAGVYDNYITTINANFGENWKMLWSCGGGVPKILIAGGGGSANNELAVLTPPGVTPVTSNISGLSGGHNDISDIIIDPVSNELYTIFSVSVSSPTIQSKIYKHKTPYTPANIAWSSFSGYLSVREPNNRPYSGILDNSSNTIAINSDYLFYWDGKNLKAFNKATGNVTGTPVILTSTEMMQGGIFADECNNVFVGSTNGTIKVFKFDGTTFNDAASPDITIPGFTTNSVYDITYDHSNSLIYTCGDGFVASIDVSQYCPASVYTLTIVTDSVNLTATISVSPAVLPGSTLTYSLFDGGLLVSSNTTGIFTGLSLRVTYTIKVFIDEACGGTQITKDFTVKGMPSLITGIYVHNAFTPNANGINDELKIALYGMRKLNYFSIYNRYGQLLFTTTNPAIGWDGKFKGKMQNQGTFVWTAEAVDQRGNIVNEKGTSTLIK